MNMENGTMTKRNVGKNKGAARLWLEGTPLLNHGWTRGTRYTVHSDGNGTINLVRKTDGKRKVSGGDGRPVIDLSTAERYGLNIGDEVTVKYRADAIIIGKA